MIAHFKNHTYLLSTLFCAACWMLGLLAFWPGFVFTDSIDQWHQMLVGQYADYHPAAHAFLYWLIARIWNSPAAVAVAYSLALALAFGWSIRELGLLGVPRWAQAVLTMVFALAPANIAMSINIGKDTPYTVAFLVICTCVMRIARTGGAALEARRSRITLGAALLIAALIRHNGIPFAFLLIISLALCFRLHLRSIAKLLIIPVIGLALMKLVIYPVVHVAPATPFFVFQNQIHQAGALITADAITDSADIAFVERLQPIPDWKAGYNCQTLNPLVYNNKIDRDFFNANYQALNNIIIHYGLYRPDILLKRQLCVTSILWKFPQDRDIFTFSDKIVDANSLGIEHKSIFPAFRSILLTYLNRSTNWRISWLLWGTSTYLYTSIVVTIIHCMRSKQLQQAIIVAPTIIHTAVLLILITVNDFRFDYPVYTIGLILPFILTRRYEQ